MSDLVELLRQQAREKPPGPGRQALERMADELERDRRRRRSAAPKPAQDAAAAAEQASRLRDAAREYNAALASMRDAAARYDACGDAQPEVAARRLQAFTKARQAARAAGGTLQRELGRKMTDEEWQDGVDPETVGR